MERQEVRCRHVEPAALAPVEEGFVGQRFEFGAVDHAEPAQGHLLAAAGFDLGAIFGKQACSRRCGREFGSAPRLDLELAVELHDLVGKRGRRPIDIEKPGPFGVVERVRGFVDAQDQLVALLGEGERIAAHESRHVDVGRPFAIGIDEQIFARLHAQDRGDAARFGCGKNERIVACRNRHLACPERHRIGRAREAEIGHRAVALGAMHLGGQRYWLAVEDRGFHGARNASIRRLNSGAISK